MSHNRGRGAVSASTQHAFDFAGALVQAGHRDQAIQAYRSLLAKEPRLHAALNNLASLLREQGQLAEAGKLAEKAIRIAPDDGVAYVNLGHVRLGQGRVKEAQRFYRQAILLSPAIAEGYNGLANALIATGASAEAIPTLEHALTLDPGHLLTRVTLGLALVNEGRTAEALDHAGIVAASSEQPNFPHFQVGVLLARAGCPEGARACFQAHLARDPDDSRGARLMLGALGEPMPACASFAQIEKLYSSRAPHWDTKVGSDAGYRGAELVCALLDRLAEPGQRLDIVDAGCGTGLVGARIKRRARELIGVDASLPMLQQAEQKGLYSALHQNDLVAFLAGHAQCCDAVTSAATLIHFGDLRPVFAGAAESLRDDGLFVFTVFPNEADENGFAVETLDGFAQGGCFRHGRDYLARTADEAGFNVVACELAVHEYSAGRPKMALVVALRRRARGDKAAAA